MANKVKAIILTGNGTNCEMEMAHACKLAGADRYDIVHISQLLFGEKRLSDYNFLNLPGGFLDGDDLGSAKAGANRFLHAPIAGICNESGRLFGLMPHPEAFLHRTNHPRWTREDLPEEGQGLAIFKNAVAFIRSRDF